MYECQAWSSPDPEKSFQLQPNFGIDVDMIHDSMRHRGLNGCPICKINFTAAFSPLLLSQSWA